MAAIPIMVLAQALAGCLTVPVGPSPSPGITVSIVCSQGARALFSELPTFFLGSLKGKERLFKPLAQVNTRLGWEAGLVPGEHGGDSSQLLLAKASSRREMPGGHGFPGSGRTGGRHSRSWGGLFWGSAVHQPPAQGSGHAGEGPNWVLCSTSPSSSSLLGTLSLELKARFTFSYIYWIKHCFLGLIFKVSELFYTVLPESPSLRGSLVIFLLSLLRVRYFHHCNFKRILWIFFPDANTFSFLIVPYNLFFQTKIRITFFYLNIMLISVLITATVMIL